MKTRKGIAPAAILPIIKIGLIVGGIGASIFMISELTNLFQVIFNNTFYIIMLFSSIGLSGALLMLANNDRVTFEQALGGTILFIGVAMAAPIIGLELGSSYTSYTADIVVDTSVNGFDREIQFDRLDYQNLRQKGPKMFTSSQQEACVIACGDWTVKAQVTCDKKDFTKRVSLTGNGGEKISKPVSGIPKNAECTVYADMTNPSNHGGLDNPTASFTTGGTTQ